MLSSILEVTKMKCKVTSANVHDFQVIENLLDKIDKGENFYVDSAYTSEKQNQIISKKELINCVHEKGYRANQLNENVWIDTNREREKKKINTNNYISMMYENINMIFLI